MNWKRLCSILLCLAAALMLVVPACAEAESVQVSLEVELQQTGDVPTTAEDATFVLRGEDGAPMPENSTLVLSGENTGKFAPITYTKPETYHYTLYQQAGETAGCTYDNTVYDVTVQVTTDDAGMLSASVLVAQEGQESKAAKAVFVNQYQSEPSGGGDTPEDPSKDTTQTEDDSVAGNAPKTGDTSAPIMWAGFGGAALLGLLGILWTSSRKQNKQDI